MACHQILYFLMQYSIGKYLQHIKSETSPNIIILAIEFRKKVLRKEVAFTITGIEIDKKNIAMEPYNFYKSDIKSENCSDMTLTFTGKKKRNKNKKRNTKNIASDTSEGEKSQCLPETSQQGEMIEVGNELEVIDLTLPEKKKRRKPGRIRLDVKEEKSPSASADVELRTCHESSETEELYTYKEVRFKFKKVNFCNQLKLIISFILKKKSYKKSEHNLIQ